LWAAFLVLTGLLAAVALGRAAGREGRGPAGARWFLAALWLAAVLVLCKSLGSLLLALLFAPVMLLAAPRWQMRLAALLAALTLAYPLARGADLVPADTLVALAARIDAERAHSLAFRLDNEQRLLDRAAERPLFGWGLWGRQFERDPQSGRQTTIPDGRWIITLGSGGWLGFAAEFGLLALPVLLIWWRMGASGPPPLVAALGLIHAVNLVDLIPNATLTPLTALAAGALWAAAEAARRAPDTAAQPAAPSPRAPAFRTVL
ncbi:hypothetical protein GT358_13430, partial [Rubellimicrobium sp. CFH 75288]|nr:hypothetical protein [Rubellimicrobium sp. CFH 75288]